jgi:hypothetical protein
MSQRGRPPKPVEVKRALGNPGKRALPPANTVVALPQIVDTPEPSRPLGTHGKQFWDRVWEMGSTWISSNTDYEAMLMTAEMVDERWNLRVKVMREGVARDRRALRDLDRAIQSQLSLLGLTPADRTRLGVAEVKKMSKLAELRQMRSE